MQELFSVYIMIPPACFSCTIYFYSHFQVEEGRGGLGLCNGDVLVNSTLQFVIHVTASWLRDSSCGLLWLICVMDKMVSEVRSDGDDN